MDQELEWEDGIRFQVRESRTALVCGAAAVCFALFILIMSLLHPSGRGGGVLLYVPLLCMLLGGAACWVMYYNRKLIVVEMNICYVNSIGRRKEFTLDKIGFCKIGVGGNKNLLVLYDLLGEKLCKLDFDMRGIAEFHQYLVDNRVEVEWGWERMDSQEAFLIAALQRETAVCGEEIRKCSETFYREVEAICREWEKHNKKFQVEWEIGYAQYLAVDMKDKCRQRERISSVEEPLKEIPDTYECLLEAYMKRDGEYVLDRRGREVSIILPYLVRSKSYQIGEQNRIRKMDERSMKDWLELQLERLVRELPRRRYHTEILTEGHRLSHCAGICDMEENVVR